MEGENRSRLARRLGDRKKVLLAAAAVALFVVAFVLTVIFFGMQVGDPRGEAPGPGP